MSRSVRYGTRGPVGAQLEAYTEVRDEAEDAARAAQASDRGELVLPGALFEQAPALEDGLQRRAKRTGRCVPAFQLRVRDAALTGDLMRRVARVIAEAAAGDDSTCATLSLVLDRVWFADEAAAAQLAALLGVPPVAGAPDTPPLARVFLRVAHGRATEPAWLDAITDAVFRRADTGYPLDLRLHDDALAVFPALPRWALVDRLVLAGGTELELRLGGGVTLAAHFADTAQAGVAAANAILFGQAREVVIAASGTDPPGARYVAVEAARHALAQLRVTVEPPQEPGQPPAPPGRVTRTLRVVLAEDAGALPFSFLLDEAGALVDALADEVGALRSAALLVLADPLDPAQLAAAVGVPVEALDPALTAAPDEIVLAAVDAATQLYGASSYRPDGRGFALAMPEAIWAAPPDDDWRRFWQRPPPGTLPTTLRLIGLGVTVPPQKLLDALVARSQRRTARFRDIETHGALPYGLLTILEGSADTLRSARLYDAPPDEQAQLRVAIPQYDADAEAAWRAAAAAAVARGEPAPPAPRPLADWLPELLCAEPRFVAPDPAAPGVLELAPLACEPPTLGELVQTRLRSVAGQPAPGRVPHAATALFGA